MNCFCRMGTVMREREEKRGRVEQVCVGNSTFFYVSLFVLIG